MSSTMKAFFARSEYLDRTVLRPLDHIKPYWELIWSPETQEYLAEPGSYAEQMNRLIEELGRVVPPTKYHDNEDRLAEYTKDNLRWKIRKVGSRWVGEDYAAILEQGGFHDLNETELLSAAAGRIAAAKRMGQEHFDDMEESHQKMLGAVLSIIMYHRTPPDEDTDTEED